MRSKVKKVLLFIPPALTFGDYTDVNPIPPLGLGYVGAVLENRGIEVRIVDCLIEGWHRREEVTHNIVRIGLSFKDIEDIISDFHPDIVGVNSLFTKQRENAHHIYGIAKRLDSNVTTIAGGAHPTVMPELVMSDPNVDFVVIGEGEDTIIKLVDVLEERGEIGGMDGVGYRTKDGVIVSPKTTFIKDLDTIPFPARHLMHMEKYIGLKESHGTRKKDRFSPIMTSRGCPAGCTFCSAHKVWGSKFRVRSPENVVAEMKHLKDAYGIEELVIEDDNITLNKDRARKLFDLMIQEKLDLVWDTPNGVAAWALDEDLIDKMKKSGCYKLNLALESGSQYVVDNIVRKPLDLEKGKCLAKYAKSIGLDVSIFLIMGMPGETKEQIWESFRMANELKIYTPTISIATPYPGTEIYRICKERNYLPPNFSLDDLHTSRYSISTEEWTKDELRDVVKQGRRYLLGESLKAHPLQILRLVIESVSMNPKTFPARVINFIRGG
jgi:anaerobic magnesium-protoporphyrin IX monomethyl ester cyclase